MRDALGNTIVSVYSPEKFALGNGAGYWAVTGVKALDTRANLLELTDGVNQVALDRYAFIRDAYMSARAKQTGTTLPGSEDDYVPSFEEDSGNTGSEATTTAEQPAAEPATIAQPSSHHRATVCRAHSKLCRPRCQYSGRQHKRRSPGPQYHPRRNH